MMILSGDRPRSPALAALLIVIVLALALAPFLFPGAKPANVAANICVLALLVASYDLLLGYAGIVSFAHVMFFGIGAYGVAIALYGLGPSWGALALGVLAALPVSIVLALAIGLFSLRVQTIFFAMMTLAVAYAFNVLASQLSWLTGGEDGRSFQVPEMLRPGFHLFEGDVFGVNLIPVTLRAMSTVDPEHPTVQPVPYTGIQFLAIPEFQDLGTRVSQQISAAIAGRESVRTALEQSQQYAETVGRSYRGNQ